MPDIIRIGIVGCGRILPAHLQGMKLLRERGVDNFRVTALVARQLEDAFMFRKRGEGPPPRPPVTANQADPLAAPHCYVSDFQAEALPECFDDYRAMLAQDGVDAVLILTALDTHHPIALAALEAGKHASVEKPLAISVRAARRMVETAEKAGKVLATAENAHYREPVRALRWLIERGDIGAVQMVVGGGIGGGDWAPDKIAAQTPWRHQKLRGGGGPVIDFGVHRFNVLRYQCGEIVAVQGMTKTLEEARVRRDGFGRVVETVRNEVEDVGFASLRFANGAIGHMMFGWGGHGEGCAISGGTHIFGSQGSLRGNTMTLDDGRSADATALWRAHAAPELKERFFPLGITDPFALEFYDFLGAIASGGQSETSGGEGLRDLAISYAVIESAQLGRWVTVEEVESGAAAGYQREIDEHYGL